MTKKAVYHYHLLTLTLLLSLYDCQPFTEFIKGPSDPSQWEDWYAANTKMRQEALSNVNYNGSIYSIKQLYWTQTAYILPQMYPFDTFFYDIKTHQYTIDKWVSFTNDQYNGVDAILMWATYTNLGIDDRNQWEMYYSLPGGIDALRNITNYLHNKYDIQVVFAYNPWDTGTNNTQCPDYQTMAQFLNDTNADGFFGDCMHGVPEEFYTYSLNTYNHYITFYPENMDVNITSINYDTLDFSEWDPTGKQPFLSTWKWLEPRHQSNFYYGTAGRDTPGLQTVFFNAIGYSATQNGFGSYNKLVPRDAHQIKIITTILRFFGDEKRRIVQSQDMKPFIPIFPVKYEYENIFANQFTVNQETLFLIVNRNETDINNVTVTFDNIWNDTADKLHIYDCYHGMELMKTVNSKIITISIDIEGDGYGAILVTMNTTTNDIELAQLLNSMNELTKLPIKSYSDEWHFLQQHIVEIPETNLYSTAPTNNMVSVPFGVFHFNSSGQETGIADGAEVQYDFEMHINGNHRQYMTINKFYIDKYPVTCSEYKQYLNNTKYQPKDPYNYLKNWIYDKDTDEYNYPNGYSNKPVTYIGLSEARSYCKWNGKRLPHSYEMQYASRGNLSYLYPWGNQKNEGINYPQTQHGRNIPGPEDVNKYSPQSDSIFGVSDLVGNVWQFTDEFYDNHTRYVLLRGSSNYYPNGTPDPLYWYFPPALELYKHGRYFIMDDSWDRSGTIGFRCVADAVQPSVNASNNVVYNWNGTGVYCVNGSISPGVILCGSVQAPKGYNNLTEVGNLDWINFGLNDKNDTNNQWRSVRKENNSNIIQNYTMSTGGGNNDDNFYFFGNNVNSFYWNDGDVSNYQVLTMNNASTYGVYIIPSNGNNLNRGFKFNLENLKQGNIYKIRIFVGVWSISGHFKMSMDIGTNNYIFEDKTVSAALQTTETVMYEVIIDLSKSSNDLINILIQWLIENGENGNITLESIAVEQLEPTNGI